MTDKKGKKKNDRTIDNVAVATGNSEIVSRYGSANAEWIKAYSGVDNETGQVFTKSLKGIAQGKLNPDNYEANIRQQAGYSAEVAKVADDNSQNIIKKSNVRTERTDDNTARRQKNNNRPDMVSDHIETVDGIEIPGSTSQMKIVSDHEGLLKKIAQGKGGGKNDLSRYMDNDHIDITGEKFDAAQKYCEEQAKELRKQAAHARQHGDQNRALRQEQEAQNYDDLKGKLRKSYTSDEARDFRLKPKIETAKRMVKISHEAGLEAAKYGAAIGGAVSATKNIIALMQGDKELQEVLCDTAVDTGKSALVGYGTGFAGSLVKSGMQQSGSGALRQLSRTSLPTLVVSTTLALGSSISRYARGEIDGVQFMEEIGEKGSGMLASGMMAALGQIAIPIPIVGGVIGGMVGYTMSSLFYRSSLQAFQEAKEAEKNYQMIKAQCEEARRRMLEYQAELQVLFDAHMADMKHQLSDCFVCMDKAIDAESMDEFAEAANSLGGFLGKTLQFNTMQEFDDFMSSDETLIL
jgi:Mu-like prophage protein